MARYIDADRLKRTFASGIRVYDGMCKIDDVMHNIENEPTADVEEVRHGEWIAYDIEPYGDGIGGKATKWYKCSECGTDALGRCYEDEYYSYPLRTDYCPKCGAKMDGERK